MVRRTSRRWFWALAGVLGGATLARWQLARWFREHPRYSIERRVGELEIRVYGPCWVAETRVADSTWREAITKGSRRLFAYISGANHLSPFQPDRLGRPDPAGPVAALRTGEGNDSSYVIPMPVDVVANRTHAPRQQLKPTAPLNVVLHEDGSYTVVFNLPEGRTLASLPAPDDERVRLERRPRRRIAVLRYAGANSELRVAEKFSELLRRVRALRLPYRGSPQFAGYDPPATLSFLRRNEVWLELEPAWT